MPKTESEWQDLSDLLAREIMDGHEETSYDVPIWAWTLSDGTDYWITQCAWRPDKNLTQAMQAVDALVEKHPAIRYWLAYKPLGRPEPDYWFTLWQPYCELYGHSLHGSGCTRARAICLALEKWLNAQKELEDASA